MFKNNKSLEEKGGNDSEERPKITSEIYELCRMISEQQRPIDGFSSENDPGISMSSHSDPRQYSKQKNQNNSSPEKKENVSNAHGLNTLLFHEESHTNSPISLHSEPTIAHPYSDVNKSLAPLPSKSDTKTNGRIQRHKEFVRPIIYKSLNDKSSIIPLESDMEVIPLFSVSHNQLDLQIKEKFENYKPSETVTCNNRNIMCNTIFKNDQFSSNSSLQTDFFSATESPKIHRSRIFNSTENLKTFNKLFHGSSLYIENQNALSFSSEGLEKNNRRLINTFFRKADNLNQQCQGLKINTENVLDYRETENNLFSLNVSLQLENQKSPKDYDVNLGPKKAIRTLSAPNKAGFTSTSEKNSLLVQTKWCGRKCKSDIQLLNEKKTVTQIKCKDSISNIHRKSTSDEDMPKQKRIPTFRGHKLPAKVSVLLLNGPILLNYTDSRSGKSREILMCTSDTIEDIIRNENDLQRADVVTRLVATSRPYIGKPIHIIFEPRKATDSPLVDDFGEKSHVSLHPSPGKYNLFIEESKEPISTHCKVHDETDLGREYSNYENSISEDILFEDQSGQLKEIENRMLGKNSSGLQSAVKRNKRLETIDCDRMEALRAKKKLKIRMCQRKKSRTDLKRVNVKQIVSSVFRNFFHFYSVLGGHLRSGSVITKSNGILWLRQAGVTTDTRTLKMANELFKDIAGAKIVLNIFDFMQFLTKFARSQQTATMDLIRQLTVSKHPISWRLQDSRNYETRRLKSVHRSNHSRQRSEESMQTQRSQSLPNLKTTPPIFNS